MARTRKPQPHYSGKQSKAFWSRVNRLIAHETQHTPLYLLGCALQDIETRTLQALHPRAMSRAILRQEIDASANY